MAKEDLSRAAMIPVNWSVFDDWKGQYSGGYLFIFG
ncbi:hypothetical protein HDEF_0804 [Candidatus Hamiltonella defensa 5AT (Acyrthosiphon pisum)]|uniref:Uncharacterized protein n=1 Tax=Hamiltonella defensa subsp. Acyrthosiphon pisum (strain 5AT) TaxID=572265 RepID=C4K4N7_HAMD5|nr:hypothetical protein HDEF_0804 [Candidatus Hamiltonella defensa 5AT (Acyrthosiphon pisum)]